MSEAGSSTAPTSSGPAASWPSRNDLVGAWARAVLQLWDLTVSWWKLIPEQGEPEDPTLGVWSTSVLYPRRSGRVTRLGWSGLHAEGADVVPPAGVHIDPPDVAAGQDNARLRIRVDGIRGRGPFHYHVTIYDRDAPNDPAARRDYGLGFGVPGAGA
jgi:hypothetical protein